MTALTKPLAWTAWETPDRIIAHPDIRNEAGSALPRLLMMRFANGALKITATRRSPTMLSVAAGTARAMHTRINSVLVSEPDGKLGQITQVLIKRLRLDSHRYVGNGTFEGLPIEAVFEVLVQIRQIAELPEEPISPDQAPNTPAFLEKDIAMPATATAAPNLPTLTIASTNIRRDDDGRYCLNDLHVASGGKPTHRPNQFLRIDQTKELISELQGQQTDAQICASNTNQPVMTVKGGNRPQGTFVCKELVYAYAMWISPKFHLAVIRAFDALVTEKQPVALASAPHHLIAQAARSRAWRYAEEQRQVFMAAIGCAAKPGDDETAWGMSSLLMTRIEERLVKMGMDMAHKHNPQTVASWLLNWRPETQLALPH